MDFPLLFMGLLLVVCLLWVSAFAYLAWFRPDRFRTLMQPPERLQKLLGKSFQFLWAEGDSDFALWNTRLVGLLAAAMILALLFAMAKHALGF